MHEAAKNAKLSKHHLFHETIPLNGGERRGERRRGDEKSS
jgi:hypothetical protein